MFRVPKDVAHKMVKHVILSCIRSSSTFTNLNFRLAQQRLKYEKSEKKCNILGSKTPKNDLLTLNTAFPVASPF